MNENSRGFQLSINLALDNARLRVNLLDIENKKCVLEEYKEWFKDGFNNHNILLIREDPII